MPSSIIRRLQSKVRSLRLRRSEVCCRSMKKPSPVYLVRTRSAIAADLLLEEQNEREQRLFQVRRVSEVQSPRVLFTMNEEGEIETIGQLTPDDSISVEATEPFPDFDLSIDCEEYIQDIFRNVSSTFWTGARERAWSWSSNATIAQVSERSQCEQELWPMSLRPVANLDTGDVLYAEVPFFLFPGYYEEDPPVCQGRDRQFMLDGEYSDDVVSLVNRGEFTADMLAFIDEMESAFGLLNDEKVWNFDAVTPDWRLLDEVEPRRFSNDCLDSFEAMKRRNAARSGCGLQKRERIGLRSKMAVLGRFILRLSGKTYRSE
ncbi:hypothetical protein BJ166DRAFT_537287 [Pestalotiopsis sp. NC0098]|nr:hypothetical protein BJ166DRAFT_537287 [Pestalotiopsis sp. NC0098]